MKKDLYQLTPDELGKLFPVMIESYHSEWPRLYENEKKILIKILGNKLARRLEHFGSTAVPGLAAKPVIDILVEIPGDNVSKKEIIQIMKNKNYLMMNEVTDHLMFVKGYTIEGIKGQAYHIHLSPSNDTNMWNRIYFRDFLRQHPDIVNLYENLKIKLAEKFRYDRDGYTEAKTDFIKKFTKKALEDSR